MSREQFLVHTPHKLWGIYIYIYNGSIISPSIYIAKYEHLANSSYNHNIVSIHTGISLDN